MGGGKPDLCNERAAGVHLLLSYLQVHVLRTVFVLLEAILPCLQKPDEKNARWIENTDLHTFLLYRPKSAKSADIKKRPPVPSKYDKLDDEDAEQKEIVEEESDSEDEVVIPDEQDNDKMPFIQSFIFSLVWALGGYLEDKERYKLEEYLRGQVRQYFHVDLIL